MRCFWQGYHQIYGHIRCINTVVANLFIRTSVRFWATLCNPDESPPLNWAGPTTRSTNTAPCHKQQHCILHTGQTLTHIIKQILLQKYHKHCPLPQAATLHSAYWSNTSPLYKADTVSEIHLKEYHHENSFFLSRATPLHSACWATRTPTS